jgi:hypothetical protein
MIFILLILLILLYFYRLKNIETFFLSVGGSGMLGILLFDFIFDLRILLFLKGLNSNTNILEFLFRLIF